MAKYKYPSLLSLKEQEDLLREFAIALSEITDPNEALDFIKDLLSTQEAEMLARRIKIAELLLDGATYEEAQKALKTSHGTIARVAEWLKYGGEGYRRIVARLKQKRSKQQERAFLRRESEWERLKRRYPLMFWPQLVVDEIIASASKRQKEKLRSIMKDLDAKTALYKKLDQSMGPHRKKRL